MPHGGCAGAHIISGECAREGIEAAEGQKRDLWWIEVGMVAASRSYYTASTGAHGTALTLRGIASPTLAETHGPRAAYDRRPFAPEGGQLRATAGLLGFRPARAGIASYL